jgi:hypothetical protein
MKIFLTACLYALIALLVLQNHLVFAVCAVCFFSYFNNTAWLIPLGFAIDGYFGVFDALPVYSLLSIVWFVVIETVRPKVRVSAFYE